jgi:uncharacterized protein (DUF2267 family)
MRTQSPDTMPEIEQRLIAEYRRMSPVQRLMKALDMNRAVQEMAAARITAEYGPDLTERELHLRLAALWIDRDTMVRAFGWDPELRGY